MITFALISAVAIVSAVMVLHSEKLVYATLWLTGFFVAIAALFLLLNAQFLAMIQIFVYAGAVITLILFAIMLAQRESGP